jgi:transposase
MEQRAVTCFLRFKGLHASAIAAELKSVYETEVFPISTVKSWCKCFAEGTASLYDEPRCGRPLTITNDFVETIFSVLKERPYLSYNVLCGHIRTAKGTYL